MQVAAVTIPLIIAVIEQADPFAVVPAVRFPAPASLIGVVIFAVSIIFG